jgi:RNA polymerase sigma-70 factor (ECF subfamily)
MTRDHNQHLAKDAAPQALDQPADDGPKNGPKNGGQEEFLWYFTKDRQRIYAFIFSLLPNATDAEDVFQQTSIVLWRKFEKFDKTRDFYAWACGVAYRDVQSFRRLAMSKKIFYDDDLVHIMAQKQLASASNNRYSLDLLDECIAHLPDGDRQIVTQVYRDELAVGEVAQRLQRANQTIYNRLNLIRNGLLECINRKRSARGSA